MLRRSYRSFADYTQHVRKALDIIDMELEVFEATPLEGLVKGKLAFIGNSAKPGCYAAGLFVLLLFSDCVV